MFSIHCGDCGAGVVSRPSIAQRDPVLGVGCRSDGPAPTVGDVVVGSELEVQLALAVPESTTSDAMLWLQCDLGDVFGFTVLSVVDASSSSSLSSSCAGDLAGRATGGDVVTNSTTALIPLCTLTNVNTNNSISEPVLVTVRAVVRDTAVVARGTVVSLSGHLSSAANSTSTVVSSWTIREPSTVSPVVASVPSPAPVLEAGDAVQYSVSPAHAGVSDGVMYNWTLTDSTLADGRYYVNRVWVDGVLAVDNSASPGPSGDNVVLAVPVTAIGTSRNVTVQYTMGDMVEVGSSITSGLNTTWLSHPGGAYGTRACVQCCCI